MANDQNVPEADGLDADLVAKANGELLHAELSAANAKADEQLERRYGAGYRAGLHDGSVAAGLSREDLELARWCAFTLTKGFKASTDGARAAGKLAERIGYLLSTDGEPEIIKQARLAQKAEAFLREHGADLAESLNDYDPEDSANQLDGGIWLERKDELAALMKEFGIK